MKTESNLITLQRLRQLRKIGFLLGTKAQTFRLQGNLSGLSVEWNIPNRTGL